MKQISYYSKILSRAVGMLVLLAVMGCVSESVDKEADTTSSEARNKAAMRRFVEEIYHQGNMAAFDEVIAETCVLHNNGKTIESLETAKRQIRMITGMYRDIRVTIDDIIAEGDLVALRTTFQGIFRRNGNELTLPSIAICRFKDGKMIESWRTFDNAKIYRQLGIEPPATN